MDQRLRQALRAVSTATAAFLETSRDHERLLQTVVAAVAQAVPNTCLLFLRSAANSSIAIAAVHDADPAIRSLYAPLVGRHWSLDEMQLVGTALASGTLFEPNLNIDAVVTRTSKEHLEILRTIGVTGLVYVPLVARGELLGVLTVLRHRATEARLDDLDREMVEHLATHAALALGNAKLVDEHQQMASELEASRFLDAVIENIPDMVFVKDAAELRFVRFNRAGEDLLGVARTDLIGKNDFDFFPHDEATFFITKDRETLASKTLVDIPEEPIQTRNGQRWLHTKKVPILDKDGDPRYLLGISEDITERKQSIAALRAAIDKAEAANRELEAFSYSVAHDLRSPLRAIDGFAQALLEDYRERLDDIGRRHLDRIRAAAQRMATLIDDLLRLSRVTRAEHQPQLISLSSLARIAVGQLERAEPDRNVTISIQDGLELRADPKLLSIALDNLFANAWKFTAKTPQPRIELGTTVHNTERVYFIRDNGAGFDMQYGHKLFGVFSRLHPMHEFPGTGIGLATVKRIIERHGGRIWAEGAVGRGATFFFTLGEQS